MKTSYPENTDEAETIPIDERITLLSSRYRRFVLYSLSLYTTPVSLAMVTDTVTELEYGSPADDYSDERLQIYTALYHNHLPRLVHAGAVRYNQSDDTVDVGPNAPQLVSLLEETITHDIPAENGLRERESIPLDSLHAG